jgi:hypothetical protein
MLEFPGARGRQGSTRECMRSSIQMGTEHHLQRTLLLRTCLRKVDDEGIRGDRGSPNRRIGSEATGIVYYESYPTPTP